MSLKRSMSPKFSAETRTEVRCNYIKYFAVCILAYVIHNIITNANSSHIRQSSVHLSVILSVCLLVCTITQNLDSLQILGSNGQRLELELKRISGDRVAGVSYALYGVLPSSCELQTLYLDNVLYNEKNVFFTF